MNRVHLTAAVSAVALALAAFGAQATEEIKGGGGATMAGMATPSDVSQQMLDAAAKDSKDFLHTNGNYGQTRFYPGARINTANAKNLHPAWLFQMDVTDSLETSP